MPKLLQINVTANWGSHGKIAEAIGQKVITEGWESYIAFSRFNPSSCSTLIRVGTPADKYLHALHARLLDSQGLQSKAATRDLISEIERIRPDIVHLHIIHGYYLNYPLLFDYLSKANIPIVWTMHDCWAFTGHCPFYTYIKCEKWISQCDKCPQSRRYPASLIFDCSARNFKLKKAAFNSCGSLYIVPVSQWMERQISKSFLSSFPVRTIYNGINLDTFKPIPARHDGFSILGVASIWDDRKGLEDFIKLRRILPPEYKITLVGLTPKMINSLPDGIFGISRTENVEELVRLYNEADVFVNPSKEDNLPTTILESLACGTPIVTYDAGGCAECIDERTGVAVGVGDLQALAKAIPAAAKLSRSDCRRRAECMFDGHRFSEEYFQLYSDILKRNH